MRKVALGRRVNKEPCFPLISDGTDKIYSNGDMYALTNLIRKKTEGNAVMYGEIRNLSYLVAMPTSNEDATPLYYMQCFQSAGESLKNSVQMSSCEWASVFTTTDGDYNLYHGTCLTFDGNNLNERWLEKTKPEQGVNLSQYTRARRIHITSVYYVCEDTGQQKSFAEFFELEDVSFEGFEGLSIAFSQIVFQGIGLSYLEPDLSFYEKNEDLTRLLNNYFPAHITTSDGTVYTRRVEYSFDDDDVIYFDENDYAINVRKATVAGSLVQSGIDKCFFAPSIRHMPDDVTYYDTVKYAFPKNATAILDREKTYLHKCCDRRYYDSSLTEFGAKVLQVLGECRDAYLVHVMELWHESLGNKTYDEVISTSAGTEDFFIMKDEAYLLENFETLVETPLPIERKPVESGRSVDKVIALIPETGGYLAETRVANGASLLRAIDNDVVFLGN